MLRVIDILKTAARRKMRAKATAWAAENMANGTSTRSNETQMEAERSRSPTSMKRETVRADLVKMMRTFGVDPDSVPLHQDELVEAEYTCALCQHVERCRAWSANGCRDDAPRLFCANAALFEELTPDPFWSESAPGSWHSDTRTSPLLRLLAFDDAGLDTVPPSPEPKKLDRFISLALAIDSLIERWSSYIDATDQAADASKLSKDLDAAIDRLFDQQDDFGKVAFARILQVALCDPRLAGRLCRLHDRSQQRRFGAQPVAT